jgi:hypothetical protein
MGNKTDQKILDCNQRWRERHREQLRAYNRSYYEEHREERLAQDRQYKRDHADQKQLVDFRYQRMWRQRQRMAIITKLGGKCVRCGFADWRALQVDHVNGGGTKERRQTVSMRRYYKAILASAEAQTGEYQLLCANCNQIKRYEDGEQCVV